MPGLVTALDMAREDDDIIESADEAVGWFEGSEEVFVGKGLQLEAATLVREVVVEAGSWLDTAIETVVSVGVAQELLEVEDTEELASALLRAWNAAARFLSFMILFWLLCLCLDDGGGTCWGHWGAGWRGRWAAPGCPS